MLGRLLNTAASTLNPGAHTSRDSGVLESVTEEEHTSSLLFPDASLLRRPNAHAFPFQSALNSPNVSSPGGFDDRGGLELDVAKDFRVVIAQNALGDRDEPCVLLDTKVPVDPTSRGLGLDGRPLDKLPGRHSRNSSISSISSVTKGSRRSSLQGTPSIPKSAQEPSPMSTPSSVRRSVPPSTGAFSRARYRSSTTTSSNLGENGPLHGRHTADSNESGLLNCIFGNNALNYRGSSTKMHVLSVDEEPTSHGPPMAMSRQGQETRNTGLGGSHHPPALSRAYSAGAHSASQSVSSSLSQEKFVMSGEPKAPSKVTVLVTRMFSVNLPDGRDASLEALDRGQPLGPESFHQSSFPFPDNTKRRKVKEKKTPMYAVAITIQLPLSARPNGRSLSRLNALAPGNARQNNSMSISLDSDYRWAGSFLDDYSPHMNLDDRLDCLVDHWDVITRTLSRLETLASREILTLLKKVDYFSAQQPKPAKAPNMQRINQTIVLLPANVLAANVKLREEALLAAQRIGTALRIPRVVTGQSRWGVWREEARCIVKSLGDKEHSFFFLVLITAFLGNHTEWLGFLGPHWYRQRYQLQQRAHQDSEPIISHRTVIVCPDKQTARRLIFLLSAFLPAKNRPEVVGSPLRPGTSVSLRPVSQSPPNVSLSRQESLRRTIKRRARIPHPSTLDDNGHDGHERTTSLSLHRQPPEEADGSEASMFRSSRRDSDVRSIRTTRIPIVPNDLNNRKSSVAISSTITPSAPTPVPHFASTQTNVFDDGESSASANLLQNLKRSESSNMDSENSDSQAPKKWGDLLSGFWGSRREPSSHAGETNIRPRQSSITPFTPLRRESKDSSKHEAMMREAETAIVDSPRENARATTDTITIPTNGSDKGNPALDSPGLATAESQARESPVKLAVRGQDGIVDVEVPLPGFLSLSSSGDSTLTSPKKTRTSVTSLDGVASVHSNNSGPSFMHKDTEGPKINVSGWLKQYHDDFVLQAVRPYANLEADVKRSMAAEPTPPQAVYTPCETDPVSGSERWVDVATTLIADTRTCTVKRLRLRRKVHVGNFSDVHAGGAALDSGPPTPRLDPTSSSSTSHFSQFFTTGRARRTSSSVTAMGGPDFNQAEEKLIEEPVMDIDGTLIDAVEKVLARSGQSSAVHSRAPSPSRGRKGGPVMNHQSDKPAVETVREEIPSIEVPRTECRRMVLGALEEVVRSVTAERLGEDVRSEMCHSSNSSRGRKAGNVAAENTLREGVRRWLLDLEEACP